MKHNTHLSDSQSSMQLNSFTMDNTNHLLNHEDRQNFQRIEEHFNGASALPLWRFHIPTRKREEPPPRIDILDAQYPQQDDNIKKHQCSNQNLSLTQGHRSHINRNYESHHYNWNMSMDENESLGEISNLDFSFMSTHQHNVEDDNTYFPLEASASYDSDDSKIKGADNGTERIDGTKWHPQVLSQEALQLNENEVQQDIFCDYSCGSSSRYANHDFTKSQQSPIVKDNVMQLMQREHSSSSMTTSALPSKLTTMTSSSMTEQVLSITGPKFFKNEVDRRERHSTDLDVSDPNYKKTDSIYHNHLNNYHYDYKSACKRSKTFSNLPQSQVNYDNFVEREIVDGFYDDYSYCHHQNRHTNEKNSYADPFQFQSENQEGFNPNMIASNFEAFTSFTDNTAVHESQRVDCRVVDTNECFSPEKLEKNSFMKQEDKQQEYTAKKSNREGFKGQHHGSIHEMIDISGRGMKEVKDHEVDNQKRLENTTNTTSPRNNVAIIDQNEYKDYNFRKNPIKSTQKRQLEPGRTAQNHARHFVNHKTFKDFIDEELEQWELEKAMQFDCLWCSRKFDKLPFPYKLHRALSIFTRNGKSHIVNWLSVSYTFSRFH